MVGVNTVERTVRGWLEGDDQPAVRPKVQLSPRISAEHADLLDAVAERLKATKHGLAQDLLEAAIEEAAALVGLQFIEDPETGETHIGYFPDDDIVRKEEK